MSTPVVKVDKMTREVVARYPSFSLCSKAENIPATTVAAAVERRTLPRGRYYYRREMDFDPCERFENVKNCPLISRDVDSGDVKWHPSLREASEDLQASMPAIRQAAHGGHVVAGRYRVAYCPIGIPREWSNGR